MAHWRHLLSKWKEPVQKKSNFLVKGTVISTLAVSSLTLGSVKAKTEEEAGLSTVYHVYVGNERIGVVTSKEEIEKWIKSELDKAKEEYQGLEFTLEEQISYVPEQVFQIATQDDSVINTLEDQVQVQAEAFAITVNGEPVTYVESAELAKQILDSIKQAYVSKEELAQLSASKDAAAETASPSKNNDTKLLDVRFTEEVAVSEEKVAPNEILTVDEALKLLQKGTLEEKKYQVQTGDVLGTIAAKHDLTLAQLLKLNPGLEEDSVLQIGEELNVTVYEPIIDVVVEYEKYHEEEIPYETKVIEDDTMFKGEQTVKQEGQSGVEAVTYLIREVNGIRDGKSVLDSKVLSKPVEEIIVKGTKVVPSRGTGDFIWPAVGGYISSTMGYRWGKMHQGIDIARPSDRTIKAADNGVVVEAGWDSGYGNKIVIDHNNGYRTVYAHLSSIGVSVGQTVPQGSKIGVMGSTGNSTGVHLHFEIHKNGKLVDPLNYF
ncbi:M23 family metallopeptidase [Bacillus litorisediminis]|uniref:M23 family metallopeptidase n=1 Tax=Bacillus litorisediminis TaxID=2922713 RepID=UPI001FAC9092|nr:M23 family metallopeptidase [Bacillus litorisediminis]